MKRSVLTFLTAALLGGSALAQSSASFDLREHTFNAGGHPRAGTIPTSASFQISLDAAGGGLVPRSFGSASFTMEGGFIGAYPPPGEVIDLRFNDKVNLEWDAEKSAGVYNLYRGLQTDLPGLGFGDCEQENLPGTTTIDTDAVPAGGGYFYLVTVENRLNEKGSKGFQSNDTEREGSVCP